MSLVSSRISMQYAVHLERDANAATANSWGTQNEPSWQPHLQPVPCNAWVDGARESVGNDRTLFVRDSRVSVPAGTDVTERDRVAAVYTKHGDLYWEGPMVINSVLVYPDHIELALERNK